jgi:FkbM family methyltransferase
MLSFNGLLATRTKIKVARMLYRSVSTMRGVAGKRGDLVTCRRGGINWRLNLQEGIDLAIYLFGRFEASTSAALKRLLSPGMVVVDIGANIGAHALPMAQSVAPNGAVIAVEPTDFAFSRLAENVALNPELSKAVRPMQVCLGEPGETKPEALYASWKVEPGAETHGVHGGALCSINNAQIQTLDHLVNSLGLTKIDGIKMDVDGHEVKVLRGSVDTLARMKPFLLLELCPYALEEHDTSFQELVDILTGLGYGFWREDGRTPLPSNAADLAALIPARGSLNGLALPKGAKR